MKHLIVSREYPPAPGGGIGTYVMEMSAALARAGDTVHVITQRWTGAESPLEYAEDGRLVIHRVPYAGPAALVGWRAHRALDDPLARRLFRSAVPAQAFAWQAALVAEQIIETHDIDVIEGQEYEAPLYYLQHRRMQGIGPARRPPIVVHLHSPSALIAQHNDWNAGDAEVRLAERLERLTILAADALLAPSTYLGQQVADMYGIDTRSVTVIPYPLPDAPPFARTQLTWERGSILYMGRLEPRKGAGEWIDAIPAVAAHDPDASFVFCGADVLDPPARRRIPSSLRDRVRLLGHRDRVTLRSEVGKARLVVVPSRWDTLPYTCIEAMASGVPVLASPDGGMSELVEHGVSGWITTSGMPADLARGAIEVLDLSGPERAAAGAAAARRVRAICDRDRVVTMQRAFRTDVAANGSTRSSQLATRLDWPSAAETLQRGDRRPLQSALRAAATDPVAAVAVLARRVAARIRTHAGTG